MIQKNNYKDLIPENKSDKLLIDMGHHLIRNCVFKYYVNKCLIFVIDSSEEGFDPVLWLNYFVGLIELWWLFIWPKFLPSGVTLFGTNQCFKVTNWNF